MSDDPTIDELEATVKAIESTGQVISCDGAEAFLAARLAGQLADAEQAALEAHLEACAGCMGLARELGAPGVADTLLAIGALGPPDLVGLAVVAPETYVRGSEVGRGGMGRVISARDRRLGRPVVLKELLDQRLREIFEHEARLTARLSHPAIISVLEAGQWPDGSPFYAMKHVAGQPLSALLAGAEGLAGRLAYLSNLITAVEAIAYAHAEGVVHRDLKPHNIVIGPFGETVVIDWGLARELGAPRGTSAQPYRDDQPSLTRAGAGTPRYMPPEQTRGEAPTTRMDVHALGATLFHLLAGHAPDERPLPPETPAELRAIAQRAMATDPAERYADAGELAEELRRYHNGKLVSAHRYTAREILGRWARRHRAVLAVVAAAVVALAAGGGVAVSRVVAAKEQAQAIAVEREQALAETLIERGRAALAGGDFLGARTSFERALVLGADGTALRLMAAEAVRRTPISDSPISSVVAAAALPDGDLLLLARDGRLRTHFGARDLEVLLGRPYDSLAVSDDGTHAAVACLIPVSHTRAACPPGVTSVGLVGARVTTAVTHDGPLRQMLYQPGTHALLTVGRDTFLWAPDGRELGRFLLAGKTAMTAAFSPDGKRLVLGDTEGEITVWDVAGTSVVARFKAHARAVTALDVDADGRIASGGWDARAKLWDGSGRPLATIHDGPGLYVRKVTHLPSRRILVWLGEGDTVTLHDDGGRVLATLDHEAAVNGVAVDVRAERLVTTTGRSLRVWTLAGALARRAPLVEDDPGLVRSSTYGLGEALGVVFLGDRRAYVRHTGDVLARIPIAESRPGVALPVKAARGLAWDDAGQLAIVEGDGAVQVWRPGKPMAGLEVAAWLPPPLPVTRDGDRHLRLVTPWGPGKFVVGRLFEPLAVIDVAAATRSTLPVVMSWFDTPPAVPGVALTEVRFDRWWLSQVRRADGTIVNLTAPLSPFAALDPKGRLLYGREHGALVVYDPALGLPVGRLPRPGTAAAIALGGDRPRVAIADGKGVTLWDPRRPSAPLGWTQAPVTNGIASPGGERLALWGAGGSIWIIDGHTAEKITVLHPDERVLAASFSPDGAALLVGGQRGGVGVWDTGNGAFLYSLGRLPGPARMVAWGPAGHGVAAVLDGVARVYPLDSRPDLDAAGFQRHLGKLSGFLHGVTFGDHRHDCPHGAISRGQPGRIVYCEAPDGTVTDVRVTKR